MKAPFNFNLSYLLLFLSGLVFPIAAQFKKSFSTLSRGAQKEVAAVKQPIDESIAYVGSSQCGDVKKLVGMDYEQVKGENAPDLNKLALHFRSRVLNMVYNLTSASHLLSSARGYDPRTNLIIYLHGFLDHPTMNNFMTISEAFLNIGEFNILGLDASSLIRFMYMQSSTYVQLIGERLGEVLADMVHKGLKPESIHLIGHSLGAHISGFTGKQFLKLTGFKVGRITGLDPAGPCFSHVDPELRLKDFDAVFVDVIHTDIGVYGLKDPMGHVDFYPNGGNQQPNCLFQTCSHSRVNELYAESITNPDAFLAKACKDVNAFKNNQCSDDISVMGYSCRPDTRGIYYLRTGEEPPYGLGGDGTRWENNDGIVRNIGSDDGSMGKDIWKNIGIVDF